MPSGPAWAPCWSRSWPPAQRRSLVRHRRAITTEATWFKGKVIAWDVVSEPFNGDGSLRSDIFSQATPPGASSAAALDSWVACGSWFVGVRCPLDVIMGRRRVPSGAGRPDDGAVPHPVRRWPEAVHVPGIYDLEVDTSVLSPEQSAASIRE